MSPFGSLPSSIRINPIGPPGHRHPGGFPLASSDWMFHGDKVVDLVVNKEVPFQLYRPVTFGSVLYGSIKHKVVGGIDLLMVLRAAFREPNPWQQRNRRHEGSELARFDLAGFGDLYITKVF